MKVGVCHLCGEANQRLTKDHIQPQCALNEKHRRYVRLNSITDQKLPKNRPIKRPWKVYYDIQPDRPICGGIYSYTQCEPCNSQLGRDYDQRFGAWCREAVGLLKYGRTSLLRTECNQICRYPLSLLKRMIAMFFSVQGPDFSRMQPELSSFVRDRQSRQLPSTFDFHVAYNFNNVISHIPTQARLNIETGRCIWVAQIAHPPFVYVMARRGDCIDSRLTNINHFADFEYNDEASIEIKIQQVPTNSCFAGDFRHAGNLMQKNIVVAISNVRPSYFRLVDRIC